MQVTNQDIRLMARGAGIPLWRICQSLEISEPTLTRKLRRELTKEEKAEIISIIKTLSKEGGK